MNPLSLHPGAVGYAQSVEASAFGSRFVFGTGLQLASVTFAASVPEPMLVMIAGLVALAESRTVLRAPYSALLSGR